MCFVADGMQKMISVKEVALIPLKLVLKRGQEFLPLTGVSALLLQT